MVEADRVEVEFVVDDKEFARKMDEVERRLKDLEAKGKKAGKGASGGFMSAAIGGVAGGVAGFVAGAAASNPATNAILELLVNIIAAALLPVMMALLPLIEALFPIIESIANVLAPILEALGPPVAALADAVADVLAPFGDAVEKFLVFMAGIEAGRDRTVEGSPYNDFGNRLFNIDQATMDEGRRRREEGEPVTKSYIWDWLKDSADDLLGPVPKAGRKFLEDMYGGDLW